MTRYLVQVAVGFAVGGFIAALGSIFYVVVHRYDSAFEMILSRIILVGAFSISGAIGGASLRKGWRPVIGFGLAFGVVGLVSSPLLQQLGQGGSLELLIIAILVVGFCTAIAFGLAGAIGTAISGLGPRMVLPGAKAFGVAGAIGGGLLLYLDNYGRLYHGIDIPKFLYQY
jgi:hypothetical protein